MCKIPIGRIDKGEEKTRIQEIFSRIDVQSPREKESSQEERGE